MNRLKKAFILAVGCATLCFMVSACHSKTQEGKAAITGGSSTPSSPDPTTEGAAPPTPSIISTPEPGSCACGQEQTHALVLNGQNTIKTIPGMMTPGIPLYYRFSDQDDQTLLTIVSTKQETITLDDRDVLTVGNDINITQTQKCNVGIYQASLTEAVRQSGTFCDTQECYTADEVTMSLFDFSHMPAVESKPSQSYQCLPTHLEKQSQAHWAIFLLMENPETPGTFYYISDQQGKLTLTNDKKTTFSLQLAPILASYSQALADFPVLKGQAIDALYKSTSEELGIEFKANFISVKGQQATHLIGTLTIGEQALSVMGHPMPELEPMPTS